jgi:hypothetical protein
MCKNASLSGLFRQGYGPNFGNYFSGPERVYCNEIMAELEPAQGRGLESPMSRILDSLDVVWMRMRGQAMK